MRYTLLLSVALLGPASARADLLGVDVSTHQGFVNWSLMKSSGVSFGFAKATEGVNFTDSRFTQNMAGARAAGVPIGPYHYARPDSAVGTLADPVKQDAINEANDFVDAIQPYYNDHPGEYLRPVLDVEELPATAEINTNSEKRQYLSDWIRDFNSVVQSRLGLDVIIYSNGFYANTFYESDLADYDLWFAAPNGLSNPPSSSSIGIWDDWTFWQYSWTGNLAGESPLDLNTFRGTVDDLQAFVVGGQGPLPGDYNDDGTVDAADYTIWRDNYLQFTEHGDGDGDGFVGNTDHDLWIENYGTTADESLAIPEPVALGLVLTASLLGAVRRR